MRKRKNFSMPSLIYWTRRRSVAKTFQQRCSSKRNVRTISFVYCIPLTLHDPVQFYQDKQTRLTGSADNWAQCIWVSPAEELAICKTLYSRCLLELLTILHSLEYPLSYQQGSSSATHNRACVIHASSSDRQSSDQLFGDSAGWFGSEPRHTRRAFRSSPPPGCPSPHRGRVQSFPCLPYRGEEGSSRNRRLGAWGGDI